MRNYPRFVSACLLVLFGPTLQAEQPYNPVGMVGSLEPSKPSKRGSDFIADSVKPINSIAGPLPPLVVQLPRHCYFDDTLPGCPGAMDAPPSSGGSGKPPVAGLFWRRTGYSNGPGVGCHMGAEEARAQQLVASGVLKPDLSPVLTCDQSTAGELVVVYSSCGDWQSGLEGWSGWVCE